MSPRAEGSRLRAQILERTFYQRAEVRTVKLVSLVNLAVRGLGSGSFIRMDAKNYVGWTVVSSDRDWVSELRKGRNGPAPGTFSDTVDGSRS